MWGEGGKDVELTLGDGKFLIADAGKASPLGGVEKLVIGHTCRTVNGGLKGGFSDGDDEEGKR